MKSVSLTIFKMSRILLVYSIVLFTSGFVSATDISLILNKDSNTFVLSPGLNKDFIAHALFKNEINTTGFSFLEVQTNSTFSDLHQAYAAGYVEGVLTRDLIELTWYNTFENYCEKPLNGYCQKLQAFLDENFKWMGHQISTHAHHDPFWHQVHLTLLQLGGLVDSYNSNLRNPSTLRHYIPKADVSGIAMLLLAGDVEDLENVIEAQSEGKIKPISRFQHRPSCSAIIKLTPHNKDLLVSHNTWNTYTTMLRTLKKYNIAYHEVEGGDLVSGRTVSFSSYPGYLFSIDDFYVLSSGLATQETTLENFNKDLWKFVKPTVVFESIRTIVANRLAKGGKDWVEVFSSYNSGTYNNQWMVVDYNKFVPGSPNLQDGLLHVAEQMPNIIVAADVTKVLRQQSYWPSYNTPYFDEIYNVSNTQSQVDLYGDWYRYDKTPRALIFKRDQHKAVDLTSLAHLMRYNDFTHDPLSRCNCTPPYSAENAISARSDLNPQNGTYPFAALGSRTHGAIDYKITSWNLSQKLEFVALSGPTNQQVPTFKWSTSGYGDSVRHKGQPNEWNFKPLVHNWKYV